MQTVKAVTVSADSRRAPPHADAGLGTSGSTSAAPPSQSVQEPDVFLSFVESEAAPQAAALASALRERGLTVSASTGKPVAGRVAVKASRVLVVLATSG